MTVALSASPFPPVSVAVVLAAGLGSRLRAVHALPKGFVEIDGEPLIARSVRALRGAGVQTFVFVLGWRADVYRDWLRRHLPQALCVENPDYATTGSLQSLRLGIAAAPQCDIMVVESDLLYEARAPRLLQTAPSKDCVLVSGFTQSGDEVWAYANQAGNLRRLTKQREEGAPPDGELVGLTRLSSNFLHQLTTRVLPSSSHYEDGLNSVAPECPIALLHVPDLAWCEIDDAAHLARARNTIWPRIAASKLA